MCIRIYIFNYIPHSPPPRKKEKKRKKEKTIRQKAKETKGEKRISVENLTVYYDIVWGFAHCTLNLLDRVVKFSWLFYKFNVVYVQRDKCSICYTTRTYKVHTFKNKNKRRSLRESFVYH